MPGLSACSTERVASHKLLCQLPHSISLLLEQVVLIGNLGKCVDFLKMYCDALSMYLNPGIVPGPKLLPAVESHQVLNYGIDPGLNLLPAVVLQLVLNYVVSI